VSIVAGVHDRDAGFGSDVEPAECLTTSAWHSAVLYHVDDRHLENELREVYCPICGRHFTVRVDLKTWERSATVKHVPCTSCQP
jgi:hypothetical protein